MHLDRERFYDMVRASLFGGRLSEPQVRGQNGLLDAFETHADDRIETLAYGLATAYHETGRMMVPVREGFAKSDAEARRIVTRAGRLYAKALPPYGHVYYGRGHVQLTWQKNYEASSADAGVDLLRDPDAMLDPVTSARILWRGLVDGRWNAAGKGIAFYLPAGAYDLENARRTVNVTDRWQDIGGYFRRYLSALQLANFETAAPIARPMPRPAPDPDAARIAAVVAWRADYPEAAASALTQWLDRRPA